MGLVDVQSNSRHPARSVKGALGGTRKRLFDIVFASITLFLTLPILLIVVTVLKLAGAGPLLAKHRRLGHRGRSFTSFEFKTASVRLPARQTGLDPHPDQASRARVLAISQFLRESGIYKLPQLVNVLRGEMSMIGPQEIHPSEVSYYGDRIAWYVSARPGLIAVSKMARRDDRAYAAQVAADIDYIRNWRFSTDLALLLRAVCAVIDR